ncbi:GNAT family N-acetyltransferase [Microvirga puerhi]|uniref:GNAT family N-acetyltransferase n=1 Tax=Microvirga puerhi TaxID=2876078 RepID=A0ABS7VLW4_9HYPH|nr:GNAT family N-acetyltransferase [Microvirga puerhi]MBZ6076518.1 GNAT family N-acetyltransferase [Microvirga puerhi]
MAAPSSVSLNLDGYTDLPDGKIAAVVTYLQMQRPAAIPAPGKPDTWSLERIKGDMDRYRTLFRLVGEPWLWFSRATMSNEALDAILHDPGIEVYALHDETTDIGLLELDFRTEGEAELAFLGVVPGTIGQGAGRFLIQEAIRRSFERPINRLFVHTCTLDHPAALSFYRRAGLEPYKRAIEVADDPRLTGHLPLQAGPHVPILEKR